MKKLYQCRDLIEAQLIKDYLLSRHIETVIHGDYLSGAAGELAAMQFPELWLTDERDHDLALKMIGEFKQMGVEDASPAWQCDSCGEEVDAGFDLCWNCSSSRPSKESEDSNGFGS